VTGSTLALIMAMTGRVTYCDELGGDGAGTLSARCTTACRPHPGVIASALECHLVVIGCRRMADNGLADLTGPPGGSYASPPAQRPPGIAPGAGFRLLADLWRRKLPGFR
jgi:hypothetical protein